MPVGVDDRILRSGPVDIARAVRPFQDTVKDPIPVRTERGLYFGSPTYHAPSTTEGTPEGTLTFTATQSAGVTTLDSYGFTVNWPDDKNNEYAEIVRQSHTVRVENPEDSEQYVDIEIADAIQFRNGKNTVSKYTFSGGSGS